MKQKTCARFLCTSSGKMRLFGVINNIFTLVKKYALFEVCLRGRRVWLFQRKTLSSTFVVDVEPRHCLHSVHTNTALLLAFYSLWLLRIYM